ncbi:MAG: sugar ABC transporter substrate-binding protein [Sphaerochaetaceae bacterium]|jgi:multiple sugar transport system substrate-binding protein|nr:sugar ABC transporter substrate-binding protein [Sphaerochaetaceae bacterium]MDX9940254.1 sugar ABC transporter substrate-binding protein [Sphaerochaetaceae bacterium]
MKKAFLVMVLVALLATTTLFAAGQQEAAKPKVTVFWALYDGLTEEYRQNLQDAFMKEYPNIELDIVPIPWDQVYDKLTTSLAGGNPPELSVIGTRWILELLALDAVEPVDKWVSKTTLDNIFDGTKEAFINGQLWGLPVAAGARILAINNTLTKKVPATMEEMRTEALRIKNATGKYGLIMPGKKHTELTDFAYYLYSAGGDFFEINADGSYGKCIINNAAGVKALTYMVDVANKDKSVPAGYLSQTRMESHPVFYAGDAGYVMIGAWVDSALKQAGASFDVTYAQIPPFAGAKPAPLVITDSIAIFSGAKNKKEAGLFLDFFYRDEWKAKFDELIGFPPVTKSAATLPQFQSPLYQALNEAAAVAKPWPLIEGFAEMSDVIWDAVSMAYLGQKTPKQALDDAAKQVDAIKATYE